MAGTIGAMRLLILGGTRFVGRAVAAAAIDCGWDVSTFNRGVSGPDVDGVRAIRGDRSEGPDIERLARAGPWDAIVDCSGYVPREVLSICQRLKAVTGRYVFISTVSVYSGWPTEPLSERSELLDCPADAGPDFGQDVEDGPTKYGYQKSGCEQATTTTFGPERSTIIRPGVVLGPYEYIGRLPWWLERIATGGKVVAPASPNKSIQPIDVRDLGNFVINAILNEISGAYNLSAPIGRESFGGMLKACAEATGSEPDFVWVPDEQLLRCKIRQWSELPLWRITPGAWLVDSSKALANGLACRPLSTTVFDTWSWMQNNQIRPEDERAREIGLSREQERCIFASIGEG
jgi:2'-hydroxyisoflavone reductase